VRSQGCGDIQRVVAAPDLAAARQHDALVDIVCVACAHIQEPIRLLHVQRGMPVYVQRGMPELRPSRRREVSNARESQVRGAIRWMKSRRHSLDEVERGGRNGTLQPPREYLRKRICFPLDVTVFSEPAAGSRRSNRRMEQLIENERTRHQFCGQSRSADADRVAWEHSP
jgi:hypothetical protein